MLEGIHPNYDVTNIKTTYSFPENRSHFTPLEGAWADLQNSHAQTLISCMNAPVKNKYITLHYIKIILKWDGDQLNHSVALQEKILRHAGTLRRGKRSCFWKFSVIVKQISIHVQYITCTHKVKATRLVSIDSEEG